MVFVPAVGEQLTVADQPLDTIDEFDTNEKVKQPSGAEEVITPGFVVPVNVLIKGASELEPFITFRKSMLFSRLKEAKFTETNWPAVPGQIV
jgi:hypothetical protein